MYPQCAYVGDAIATVEAEAEQAGLGDVLPLGLVGHRADVFDVAMRERSIVKHNQARALRKDTNYYNNINYIQLKK